MNCWGVSVSDDSIHWVFPPPFPFKFCQIAVLCVRQSNLQGRTQSDTGLIVVNILHAVVSPDGWGKFASPANTLARKRWMRPVEGCDERCPQFGIFYSANVHTRPCSELKQSCAGCGVITWPSTYFPPSEAGYRLQNNIGFLRGSVGSF